MSGPEHVPLRPSWTCRACDVEWPCTDARLGLNAEAAQHPVAISLLLSGYWWDAQHELRQPADALYARFMGWLRRGPASGAEPGS